MNQVSLKFEWKSEGVVYNKLGEDEENEMILMERGEGGGDWSRNKADEREEEVFFSKDRVKHNEMNGL